MSETTTTGELKSRLSLAGVIKRLPFTLIMVAILLLVAWWTHSYVEELAREWVSRLGFAARDFWLLRWERLILSALVTSGGSIFWFGLGMVAASCGIVEWKLGSLRAAITFWGVHIATLVIESVLFLLPLLGGNFAHARALFYSQDVGPSAGYLGSLGAALSFLPKPWRWVVFAGVLVYLGVSLYLPPRPGETAAVKLSADLAHLLAFPLGWASALVYRKSNA